MALITDPDFLNQATEVVFDTTNKTIQCLVAGNLSNDGVTLQALYSFTKEEWKNDPNLIKYAFPFVAITPESFEFVNGWTPADDTTIGLLRNGGFAIKNSDGSSAAEYIGVITLGSIGANDQVYYTCASDGDPIDVLLTGAVNQCVLVFDGVNDYRDFFRLYVREQAKTYASSNHVDIGVESFTYQAYRFPLANADDLKVTKSDAVVDALGITITYGPVTRNIGGTSYQFNVVIDGNDKSAEDIYMAVQSALRKSADIDAGAGVVAGKTATSLVQFVGDTLVTSTGVYIDNFQALDTNRLEFFDTSGTKRTYPYVAAGIISFNANLVSDTAAVYKMYYTDTFGTPTASVVQDASGAEIAGVVTGPTISFDYDYDGEGGTDKNVTVVAIGLSSAQYVLAEATITRSTQNAVSLVSALERNYVNN